MTKFTDELEFGSGAKLKNRLMMSPMTTTQSFYNGEITQDEIEYYRDRADGLGAVITGAANVEDLGKGWFGELSVAHDNMIPGLSALAKGIQSKDTKAILQIVHAGRMTHRAELNGQQIVSASDIPALRDDAENPRPQTLVEVKATIKAFGEATRRAIQAGFDGIELHGANTYLIQQYFSPHSNRRVDEYGGDRAHRFNFIKEILITVFDAVDKYATAPFIVGYRFSPEEFETPGIRMADTKWLVDQLSESRLDYLHVSLNKYASISRDENYHNQGRLAYVREWVNGRKPIVGVGGVRTRKDVENVLQSVDLVAVGQQILFDPTWAIKLNSGHDEAMVQIPFKDAVEITSLSLPLYEFVAARYHS